jgi:L-alanine-DL-glutamate epimerase-like enolase superfamily enzyme
MKITAVSFERLDLKLKVPYTIAYETVSEASNVILKIETSGSLVGWGCAAPDMPVTLETAEDVITKIESTIKPYLIGKDPFNIVKHLNFLKDNGVSTSSLAMVDMALLDLISRKAELPLYKFLGGYRKNISTSITIGILNLRETIFNCREYQKQGFNIFKIKGGLNLDEDIERLVQARRMLGNNAILRFDANQGYSYEECLDFVDKTKEVGIEIFEQPTKMENEVLLAKVTNNVPIPVMADESIKNLSDAFRLTQSNSIDMINIKLQKVGGIHEANHINSVARSAGVECMVGCLDESALSISAGLHFALSRPNIEFVDLDGHLDFEKDPYQGIFNLKNGVLTPSEDYGLGKING